MNKIQTFQEFIATQGQNISLGGFVFNLLLAAVLAYLLGKYYVKYGKSLSNRVIFARNFLFLTMTTMLIITVVKSSLALSLGLVGALSIVRFRAAIKEPEELSFLFLAISVGLGLGANQTLITVIGFIVILLIISLRDQFSRSKNTNTLYLNIAIPKNHKKSCLKNVVKILRMHGSTVELKRLDESKEGIEASFFVEFKNFKDVLNSKEELKKLDRSVSITFINNKGLK